MSRETFEKALRIIIAEKTGKSEDDVTSKDIEEAIGRRHNLQLAYPALYDVLGNEHGEESEWDCVETIKGLLDRLG